MTDVDRAFADGRMKGLPYSREFLLETKDRPAVAGILSIAILTSVVVLSRALSRTFIVRRFGFDDALAIVSWGCFIAFVGICIELIRLGSGRHFPYIQHVLPPNIVMRTQVLDFAAHIVYTTALLLCRFSGLAFYFRVCGLHRSFLIAIQIVGVIIVAGYVPQMILIIFHCRPLTGLWPYEFEPHYGEFTCLQWGLVYSVNSSVSLLCDLLLFGIPVAMLKILEMSRKRKIQLACILLPGIGVVGISIARLVLVIQGQWQDDMSWAYNPMLGVETSEIGATLIALSVPGIKPIFDKYVLNKNPRTESGNSNYLKGSSRHSKGTALSTLRLRSQHSKLASRENTATYQHEVSASSRQDDQGQGEEGILVRVDFDVKEEDQFGRDGRMRGGKHGHVQT